MVTDVPDDCKIMTQEPFGPIAPIVTFKTFDEVVERANSLEYGLAAYAFTSSNATAAAIGDAHAVRHGRRQLHRRSRRRRRRSAASRSPATAARAASRGSSAYLNTKFISQG